MASDRDKTASDYSSRSQKDFELWKKWVDNGKKPEDFKPLLQQFRPMIRKETHKYAGNVELPKSAIQGEFVTQFAKAANTYDPNKGAALGTWVGLQFKKGQRWIGQRQNTVRIAENIQNKITEYNTTYTQMESYLGRPPTDQEIAEKMRVGEKTISRIRKQQRPEYIGSSMDYDATSYEYSKEKEILKYLPQDLTPQERLVWEHTIGTNGKKRMSGNEIARMLGVSPSTVSRIKAGIEEKKKVYY